MQYQFKTVWHFSSPLSEVWDIIFSSGEWPVWWKSVKKAEVVDLKKEGVGSKVHYSFTGILPYQLTFDMILTNISLYKVIEGRATGDLEGIGRWEFVEEGKGCKVTYSWNVVLQKKILKHISPLINPIFIWNHDYVMEKGKKGIDSLLQKS